jgi:hypothetical protein
VAAGARTGGGRGRGAPGATVVPRGRRKQGRGRGSRAGELDHARGSSELDHAPKRRS